MAERGTPGKAAGPDERSFAGGGSVVRDITDGELNFYREHGWTRLERLVSSADAAALLSKANELASLGEAARSAGETCEDFWFSWSNSVFEARYMNEGPFVDLARSEAMGQLAARLIGAEAQRSGATSIRSLGGNLFCKFGGDSPWGKEIPFHQDGPSFNVSDPGFVTVWIALDDVSPDQGGMQFLDGSHRVGALEAHRSAFPLQRHPDLVDRFEVTAPLQYAAGDASAHHGFTLHGSPANRADRSRWGYACLYVASGIAFDDSAYQDRPHGFRPPLERYPVVYHEGE